jgi:hypothetical protein
VTGIELDHDWDQPWALGKLFQRAEIRCANVAASERLLGYDDTAQTYKDMAAEFKYLALWAQQQIYKFPAA